MNHFTEQDQVLNDRHPREEMHPTEKRSSNIVNTKKQQKYYSLIFP